MFPHALEYLDFDTFNKITEKIILQSCVLSEDEKNDLKLCIICKQKRKSIAKLINENEKEFYICNMGCYSIACAIRHMLTAVGILNGEIPGDARIFIGCTMRLLCQKELDLPVNFRTCWKIYELTTIRFGVL